MDAPTVVNMRASVFLPDAHPYHAIRLTLDFADGDDRVLEFPIIDKFNGHDYQREDVERIAAAITQAYARPN